MKNSFNDAFTLNLVLESQLQKANKIIYDYIINDKILSFYLFEKDFT